jgi:hypothetical protein
MFPEEREDSKLHSLEFYQLERAIVDRSFYSIVAIIYCLGGILGLVLSALQIWTTQPEISIFSAAFVIAGVLILKANRNTENSA